MSSGLRRKKELGAVAALALACISVAATLPIAVGATGEPFPERKPSSHAEAARVLGERVSPVSDCLVPVLERAGAGAPFGQRPGIRWSLGLLRHDVDLDREKLVLGPGGLALRYTVDPISADRIDGSDHDGTGHPDIVDAALSGFDEARSLLVDQLGLTAPRSIDVVFVELGSYDGYTVAPGASDGAMRILLDASPSGGADGTRRAAVHHYAHAVAESSAPGMPGNWGEAFAAWVELTAEPALSDSLARRVSARLERLDAGLLDEDLSLATGNALWFAFLDRHYGRAAVRATFEELSVGTDIAGALEQAVLRVSGDDLSSAFREFHLWSVLVGERSDTLHFPFAKRLPDPHFATTVKGLPVLSVQGDPAIGRIGAAHVRLVPQSSRGGMRIRFEGDYATGWEADLLLVESQGSLRRLSIPIGEAAGGEVSVPVRGLSEAILFVRNLGPDDGSPHRFTFAADLEANYPFVLAAAQAVAAEDHGPGVLVSWETDSEQDLIGWDLLRERADGDQTVKINPVWIPALGDTDQATDYHFLDHTAEPGVAYRYRIRGITASGLVSATDPFPVQQPGPG